MTVESQELRFRTHREGEILDITDKTQRIVDSSKLKKRGCRSVRARINRSPNHNRMWARTFDRFPYSPWKIRPQGGALRAWESLAWWQRTFTH